MRLLLFQCIIDDAAIASGADVEADGQQRVYGAGEQPSAVPAKDELVEVGGDMLLVKAVVGAHRPTLHV